MKEITPKQLEAKVFCLKGWVALTQKKSLFSFFQKQLEIADFTILNFTDQNFPNGGYTAMWLLAESHLAIHSFAESGWTYLELTSCNQPKSEIFKTNILKSKFKINLDKKHLEISEV